MSTSRIDADRPAALSCHAIERLVCEVWSEFFEREVHPDDDFYTLGGDSVAIVETVHAARQRGLACAAPKRSAIRPRPGWPST